MVGTDSRQSGGVKHLTLTQIGLKTVLAQASLESYKELLACFSVCDGVDHYSCADLIARIIECFETQIKHNRRHLM